MAEVDPFIRELYRDRPFKHITMLAADSMYKKWVRRAIEEGISEPVTRVQTAFDAVDKDLPFDAVVAELEKRDYIGISYESVEEDAYGLTLDELDRKIEEAKSLAEDLGKKIVVAKKEEIAELERDREKALRKARRLAKVLGEKEDELEKMRRQKEDLEKRYKRETERLKLAKIVTVRFKVDVPAFIASDMARYGPYREGEIAGIPEPNAAVLIEKGIAEAWVLAPPPPVKPPISEVVRRVLDDLRRL